MTRDLFKNIRDTKETFHTKMGTIKDKNGMYLTEAEDINKWREYTEELYKKHFHDPDNHSGMITHLEPDILECKVKWVLGSITTNKASGGDGIPVELFKPRSPALQADSLPAEAPGKFMVHVLLKPGLETFEHYFTSV